MFELELKRRSDTEMKHYWRSDIKFEIVKLLRGREFGYLVPTWLKDKKIQGISDISNRHFLCTSVQFLDLILNTFFTHNRRARLANLFYSLPTYDHFPPKSLNLRKGSDDVFWKKDYWHHMIGWDFLIDIDAKAPFKTSDAYKSAKIVKRLFDRYKIAYELRFSGRGFHIIVPWSALPHFSFDPMDRKGSIYAFCRDFVGLLKQKASQVVDDSILDSRRLCKMPYSAVFYENETFICWPFKSDEEFAKFRAKDYNFYSAKMHESVRDRGLFTFNAENKDRPDLITELYGDLENGA